MRGMLRSFTLPLRFFALILLSSALTTFVVDFALAQEAYDPLPLAPMTATPACDPQPPDSEKVARALAFLVSRSTPITPVIEVDGNPTSRDVPKLTVARPQEALTAQPKCCWIAYDDRETRDALELKSRLGENFGGFAYVKIGQRDQTATGTGEIYYLWRSFVLDACGGPVVIMSDD